MPGIGTLSNALFIAAAVDATLAVLSTPTACRPDHALVVAGIVLNGRPPPAYVGARSAPARATG